MKEFLGFFFAVMVFVYPLGLPIVTVWALVYAARAEELQSTIGRSIAVLPLLGLLCTPGRISTGAGQFLLPWWLHRLVGHTGVDYYPAQYLLVCVAGLLVLWLCIFVWRRLFPAKNPSA